MNIEILARQALSELKKYPNFPEKGLIAGASLSNLMWEYVSGNKAIINDIDLFILDGIIDIEEMSGSLMNNKKASYIEKEILYYEDYRGIASSGKNKECYFINKVSVDGIYNFVNYSSNMPNPEFVISSFDINCTQIGYSIEEDKFYWTKDFEYFLESGKLQLVNASKPAHSAIRLAKKQKELNIVVDKLEFDICQYCLSGMIFDLNSKCFSDKNFINFNKNKDLLDEFFTVQEDEGLKNHFKEKDINIQIYTLFNRKSPKDIFNDELIDGINSCKMLLFYIRNVKGDMEKTMMWKKLKYIFYGDNYLDIDININDVNLLSRLIVVAPKCINNLKGFKLSEQLSIVNGLFNKYDYDPIIAISILEKFKIYPDKTFDDQDLLLMELSVRKEIVDDTYNKVNRVLDINTNQEILGDLIPF